MYFILTKDCNKAHYLLENKEYTLGRKACDIIIQNDTSISRKHASISVKQGKIVITDLGARYNTFVNNIKLQPNVETALNIGDEIKLGILETIYILKEQKLITACSGLTLQEKKRLAKIMKELNGTVLMTWSQECSCLTVNEIMLTLKTLCALIVGQPIVTMNFWLSFVKNVKKSLPPPDYSNYKAVYAESILNRNIESANQQSRKSLFQNKVLVFKTKLAIAKIEAAVELAGGTCVHFNEKKITKEKFSLCNPEYLLIQDDEKDSNQNDSFINMVKYIQSIGKRSIPFQEIAMAIVTGSCEKNCNPNFDRIATLVKNEEMVFTNDILATETQTQNETFFEKPTVIVPDTELEMKPLESIDFTLNNTNELNVLQSGRTVTSVTSTFDNLPSTSKELRKNKNHDPSSGKREAQEMGNVNKRIRLENTNLGTSSSMFVSDTSKVPPRNTVVTSTQRTSQDDEEMDIKLESIDEILNNTVELDLHKAKMGNRETLKNSNKDNNLKKVVPESKNCNDSNSGKKEGQKICNDNKRIGLEDIEIGTYSSVFGNKTSNLLPKNNAVTSTEKSSHSDEESYIKLVSADGMRSKRESMKNSNEHNSVKRVGEELNKEGKRTRIENSNTSKEDAASPLTSTVANVSAVIDLTQDNDKIVTSTQVEKTCVQRSYETDKKNLKPENPFGFTRCGSKSKSKNTANISDFFKPVLRNTPNESAANISRISADTTLLRGKKKSPEKSSIKQNPFALNKPQASNPFALNKSEAGTSNQLSLKTNPSTSSDSKNDNEKVNPFGDFRKKNDKSMKKSSASTEKCEFAPYIFDISAVDSDTENKYDWLSKDSISKDEPDCTSKNAIYSDEKLQKFFESFRNCVVVETLPEPVSRISQNKSREESLNGKTNFKKFRKVQPLHMQTTIIPRSLYSTS